MPLIVNVIGIGRKSGKTTLIEVLVRGLSERGYRVATVKHISEGSFDTAQKDTWKHLQAGATKVIAMSPNEMVSIQRIDEPLLGMAVKEIGADADLILVEGFKATDHPKIIAARTPKEAKELLKNVSGVFAISGPVMEKVEPTSCDNIPLIKQHNLVDKLEEMIRKKG